MAYRTQTNKRNYESDMLIFFKENPETWFTSKEIREKLHMSNNQFFEALHNLQLMQLVTRRIKGHERSYKLVGVGDKSLLTQEEMLADAVSNLYKKLNIKESE